MVPETWCPSPCPGERPGCARGDGSRWGPSLLQLRRQSCSPGRPRRAEFTGQRSEKREPHGERPQEGRPGASAERGAASTGKGAEPGWGEQSRDHTRSTSRAGTRGHRAEAGDAWRFCLTGGLMGLNAARTHPTRLESSTERIHPPT